MKVGHLSEFNYLGDRESFFDELLENFEIIHVCPVVDAALRNRLEMIRTRSVAVLQELKV